MSKHSNFTLAFLLGALSGLIIGMLIPEDTKQKGVNIIKEKSLQIEKKLREYDQIDAAFKVFNSRSQQAVAKIQEAKELLISKVMTLKNNLESIDRRKYGNLVQSVVKQVKSTANLTAEETKKLTNFLKEDFNKIKEL